MDDMRIAADLACGTGTKLKGAIAVGFGCPVEGDVPLDRIEDTASQFAALGFDALTLGDATGMATPLLVRRTVRRLQSVLPQMPPVLHFHNTRGVGLANAMEGLALGVTGFESELAGIGGCPLRQVRPATSAPKTRCPCCMSSGS